MSGSSSAVVVQKYGGSSVASVEKLRLVARRIADTRAEGLSVVVVCSAMGNTTSELLGLARKVSPAPARRELDMLLSVGERIGMTLLTMAVNDLGVPAQSFTGSQSGIITDESHARARVVAVRPHRIQRALDEGVVAIVAGYQGVSRDKEVTTLGRGGSDTTAVVLAAALGARWCEICSDVDGIYSADPRAVPDTVRLDRATLAEALALARNGARVLNADAVAYARREGVQMLLARTTERAPGTRIQVPPLPPRVAAVAADGQLEWFTGPDPLALGEALQAAGAPLRHLGADGALADLKNWPERADFNPPAGVTSRGRVAALTAAAQDQGRDPALLRAGADALADAGLAVLGWRTEPDAITWWVDPAGKDIGQAALHARLIKSA